MVLNIPKALETCFPSCPSENWYQYSLPQKYMRIPASRTLSNPGQHHFPLTAATVMGEHGNLLISFLGYLVVHGLSKSWTRLSKWTELTGYLVRPATDGSDRKESACKVGDPGLIPGSEDPLEKEMATHSIVSCLENSMDSTVHGVTKSQTRLSS